MDAGLVQLLGRRHHSDVLQLMRNATFLVMPSLCYETFGLTILEAFATGLPVIASDLGSMASLVTHRRTGLHFTPGDAHSLAEAVLWAQKNPDAMGAMQREARAQYEAKYTAERNYQLLMDIYRAAMGRARAA